MELSIFHSRAGPGGHAQAVVSENLAAASQPRLESGQGPSAVLGLSPSGRGAHDCVGVKVGEAGPDCCQQFDQLSPLRLGESCHGRGLQRDHFRQELIDESQPVVGDRHEQPAPVSRVRSAFDQPTPFQGVEQRGDAGSRDDEPLRDGRRRQRLTGALQDRQRLASGPGQVVVPQGLVHRGEEPLADLNQGHDAGVGGLTAAGELPFEPAGRGTSRRTPGLGALRRGRSPGAQYVSS